MKREHAYKLRELMHKAAVSLPDEDALEAVELFPVWEADKAYAADERIRYGEKLYRCVQAHTSQADWIPPTPPRCGRRLPSRAKFRSGGSQAARRTLIGSATWCISRPPMTLCTSASATTMFMLPMFMVGSYGRDNLWQENFSKN